MGGVKRSHEFGPTTRSGKSAKTSETSTPAKGKKGGAKKKSPAKALPASQFKAKALPLHVNVTHTPPTTADDDTVPATSADPGHLGSVTLLPSSFNTGSYGWKGSKRLTIELENDTETKEKVLVMLTINATVLNSKNAPTEGEESKEEAEEHAEENAEKVAEQDAEKDTEKDAEKDTVLQDTAQDTEKEAE